MFPLLESFIALAQSDISAITLSACVMVGRVIFFVIKMYCIFEAFVVGGFYVAPMRTVVLC